MLVQMIILFFVTLLTGLMVYNVQELDSKRFKVILDFAGAYLFSITIIHILPEVFTESTGVRLIGLYVLLGYFMQLLLEYFTSGVEHGHLHSSDHGHKHSGFSTTSLLVALCIHALLEGSLMSHSESQHGNGSIPVLVGVLLHKMPAAFALMSVLICDKNIGKQAILLLILFALATPMGMILSNYLGEQQILSNEAFMIILAIVAGNFLHISTTIFFESSPEHDFNGKKLALSLLGAGVAIVAEFIV